MTVELSYPPKNKPASIAVMAGLTACVPGAIGVLLARNYYGGMIGITICVFLIAMVGIGFGVVGLAKGKDPRVGRAGLAMIGTMLSVLGLFFSFLSIGAILHARSMDHALPAIEGNAQFVMLAGSGNIGAAQGLCVPGMDELRLTDAAEQFEKWGVIQDVNKYYGGEVHSPDNVEVWTLIRFDKTAQVLTGQWTRIDGILRLKDFNFAEAPPSATQPGE